jgi:membrane fusion protein, heavy metal efflux system
MKNNNKIVNTFFNAIMLNCKMLNCEMVNALMLNCEIANGEFNLAFSIKKAFSIKAFSIKKAFSINFITVFSILLLVSCAKNQEKAEIASETPSENTVKLTDAQLKNAQIETGKIENRSIAALLKVNGSIDVPPQNIVSISVPSGGYLKSTRLLEGMNVSKGQVLCTIEDRQFIQMQEDYLLAKAKIGYAKAEYERQKELNQSKASSDKVYQQAETDYNTLTVLVQSYSEKLKFAGINPNTVSANNISKSINVYSPISGSVSKVNVNIGRYLTPSDVLFEIVNPANIQLVLNIFEKDVNKLYIGQTVMAYTNANPNKKYPCKITLISKNLNDDHSIEVHCRFAQQDKTIIPGMFMNAEIETQGLKALAIPSEAIVRFEGKQYVFTQSENKKYEMHEVATQNSDNGFTQITFVDKIDRVNSDFVIKGAYPLLMKMKNTEDE